MEKKVFILAHQQARNLASDFALKHAPEGWWVTFAEPLKSREQEKKYHAMVGDIAEQWHYLERKWAPENLKRILVSAFKHDTKDDPDLADAWREVGEMELAPGLRGEFVVLGTQTRDFKKKLASAFVEWLYSLGAEHDVIWSEKVINWPTTPMQLVLLREK